MKVREFHILRPAVALEIGECEAIILERIAMYCRGKWEGHKLEGEEGRWIYNSVLSWQEEHFPHWSESKVYRGLKSLEKQGLIRSKKANFKRREHTKWYTINEEEYIELNNRLYGDIRLGVNNARQNDEINNITERTKTDKTSSNEFDEENIRKEIDELIEEEVDRRVKDRVEKEVEERIKEIAREYRDENGNKVIIQKGFNFEEEAKVAGQMVELWNKVFAYSIKPIKGYANQKNQSRLLQLYKTIFNSDLDNWREYACKVNSSQFLMGEKETKNNFKAVFSWLIKEETVKRILSGEYGVGDRELDMNNLSRNIEEKKKEIKYKADKKIAEYIKAKTDNTKERREFEEYIRGRRYEEDGDRYRIGNYVRNIGI